MSTAGCSVSTKSSGCGSMLSWMPSRSKIGTSSSMESQKAASQVSVVPPAQQELKEAKFGDGPRPNSEFIVSQSISTATRMAFLQYRIAATRSTGCGLAQRYMGRSEASFTPLSLSARLNSRIRSG